MPENRGSIQRLLTVSSLPGDATSQGFLQPTVPGWTMRTLDIFLLSMLQVQLAGNTAGDTVQRRLGNAWTFFVAYCPVKWFRGKRENKVTYRLEKPNSGISIFSEACGKVAREERSSSVASESRALVTHTTNLERAQGAALPRNNRLAQFTFSAWCFSHNRSKRYFKNLSWFQEGIMALYVCLPAFIRGL